MKNSVYISYHRLTSPYAAHAIYQTLRTLGIDVFIDVEEKDASNSEVISAVCLEQIAARVYFIVVLTPGSLDHFTLPQNALRIEIEHAVYTDRKLMVLATPEFKAERVEKGSSDAVSAVLRAERSVTKYSTFTADVTQLTTQKLLPIDWATASYKITDVLQRKNAAANALPIVREEYLIAQSWFEQSGNRSSGDFEGILSDLDQAIQLNSGYVLAYLRRAFYRRLKGNYNAAIIDCTAAIRLVPRNSTPYAIRALVRCLGGDLQGAIADYTKSIDLNANQADLYIARASMYTMKANLDAAIADYTSAIWINPQEGIAFAQRGELRRLKADYGGALGDLTQAIELGIRDLHITCVCRGRVRIARGDVQGALVDYTEAIHLKPDNANAYYYRGLVYQTQRDSARAIGDFTKAIKLEPNHCNSHLGRGISRHFSGDKDGALADYTRVLDLLPDTAQGKELHALVIKLGRMADSPLESFISKVIWQMQALSQQ